MKSPIRRLPLFVLLMATAVLAVLNTACPVEDSVTFGAPPVSRVEVVTDNYHGTDIGDPYRWLEDQESPETRAWLEEQNAYTDGIMNQLPREQLTEIITKMIMVDKMSIPIKKGNRYFYTKKSKDQDLNVLYMREGLDGEEKLLLDPHTMSEDHSISVGFFGFSEDGQIYIYYVREGGKDEISIHFYDLESDTELPDMMSPARYYGVDLTPDKKTLFYTILLEDGPRVFKHTMGQSFDTDTIIFGEGYDISNILYASLSKDGNWLLLHISHGSSGPVALKVARADKPTVWTDIIDDGESHNSAVILEDKIYIQTDLNAPNGKIAVVDVTAPQVENWKDLIPELQDSVMQEGGVDFVGGHFVVNYLKDVKSVLAVYDAEGNRLNDIDLGIIGSVGYSFGDWDSPEYFYSFSSVHVASTIYRYDMSTGEKTVWYQTEIPINSDDKELKQVFYESKDGTKVPMFILHRKGIELDGSHPTLLEGYGGFLVNETPDFSTRGAAWVENGGVWAVANLRGGGEYGEAWHQAGMMFNKQNTFDDYIAAGEYLISAGYTSSKHLGILGGSNGGLLVTAVETQRPDLFGAVVCTYPLIDMVRYHMFMVARYWVSEYGSSEDPDQFKYILGYSPYQHVVPGTEYPATLFITGDGDTRVAPLHARKMTALMQASQGGKAPILLRYHMKAGHSGGMPASEVIQNTAEMLAFLQWQLGK